MIKKLNVLSLIAAMNTMGVAPAGGGQVQAAPAPGATPPAAPKAPAAIVRGVMPVLLVYLIKFESDAAAKDADVAKMFGTTSGKVSDIRKGRNFAYLKKEFKPTAEQKAAAVTWLKAVPGYGEPQDKLIVSVEKFPVASEAEAKAFLDGRASSRTKTPKAAPASETSSGNGKAAEPAKTDPKAAKDLTK